MIVYVVYRKEGVSDLKFVSREYDLGGVELSVAKDCYDNNLTPTREYCLSERNEKGFYTYFGGNFCNYVIFEDEPTDEEKDFAKELDEITFENK